jgi:hypothetical protein
MAKEALVSETMARKVLDKLLGEINEGEWVFATRTFELESKQLGRIREMDTTEEIEELAQSIRFLRNRKGVFKLG